MASRLRLDAIDEGDDEPVDSQWMACGNALNNSGHVLDSKPSSTTEPWFK